MSSINYRLVEPADIPALARLRASAWGDEEFWQSRISLYLAGEHSPQHALARRVIYVAADSGSVIGFIAGHLTRRYSCDGELQWINVDQQHRSSGIASALLKRLAQWFAQQGASRVCVDVDPSNFPARRFYTRHGAEPLNAHWLVFPDIKSVLSNSRASKTKEPS